MFFINFTKHINLHFFELFNFFKMKRVILLLSLSTIFSIYALAQQRGDLAVGGGITFGTSTSYTTVTTLGQAGATAKANGGINFGFNPEVSYFVIDNLSLSAGLGYSLNASGESPDVLYTNVALFTIGANYYVHIISDKFFYTPGFTLGFGGGSLIQDSQTMAIPFVLGAYFDLGRIEFKPTNNWGVYANLLSLTVSYARMDATNLKDTYTELTNVSFGLNYGLSVGVKYYF